MAKSKGFWGSLILMCAQAILLGGICYIVAQQLGKPRCNKASEGAVNYHGQYGGMDYVCHGGKWYPLKKGTHGR